MQRPQPLQQPMPRMPSRWRLSGLAAVLCGLCTTCWAQSGNHFFCIRMQREITYNTLLEDKCRFDGKVSDRFTKVFAEKSCKSQLNRQEVDKISAEKKRELEANIRVYGIQEFCNMNERLYNNY